MLQDMSVQIPLLQFFILNSGACRFTNQVSQKPRWLQFCLRCRGHGKTTRSTVYDAGKQHLSLLRTQITSQQRKSLKSSTGSVCFSEDCSSEGEGQAFNGCTGLSLPFAQFSSFLHCPHPQRRKRIWSDYSSVMKSKDVSRKLRGQISNYYSNDRHSGIKTCTD